MQSISQWTIDVKMVFFPESASGVLTISDPDSLSRSKTGVNYRGKRYTEKAVKM
jgi:hypothetical protein